MAGELNNLNKALRFFEDEQQSIMMPLGMWHGEIEPQGFYLVGKLLGRRSFNFEAFKNTMFNSFNPGRGLEFRLIEDGRILFKFEHTLDRRRVLEGELWAFEKNLLILRSIEENDNPARVELTWTCFHVHDHDLPLSRMTKEIATFISNQLGIFRDVDLDRGGQGWGSYLHIRVGIDISKPLRRIMKLRTVLGEDLLISFTYECLPNFCYWCGRMGHILKFCDSQYEEASMKLKSNSPLARGSGLLLLQS
ncbi:UNVERIFIED_CONTAM: hypothetical protein Sradi_2666300 [Sesamum radiatum]|uniref:CCHC-type domain-containing protein n=1 Tax=Sesamum radiatum TaxID=300843 RepID=A0AAW2S5Q3_SESRA